MDRRCWQKLRKRFSPDEVLREKVSALGSLGSLCIKEALPDLPLVFFRNYKVCSTNTPTDIVDRANHRRLSRLKVRASEQVHNVQEISYSDYT